MMRKLSLRLIVLLSMLLALVWLPATEAQPTPQSSQTCLRCKLRCAQSRDDCVNGGIPYEACEEGYNECIATCYSVGQCP